MNKNLVKENNFYKKKFKGILRRENKNIYNIIV